MSPRDPRHLGPARGGYHLTAMVDRASPYLRLFAPLALGLFAVVFVVIVLSTVAGTSDSEQASESRSAGSTDRRAKPSRRDREKRLPSATYRVKEGDTLAGIASKTGRSPERLEDYNPGLDAQTLQPGQKLKLRE